ncbi:MAG: 4'-phosphopantetheinyl transferase superfamily protein [Firmicutes bacterium]|nr:4'-phosphopantetheinyl transferase superfamily protein [Bacillota bacterium]
MIKETGPLEEKKTKIFIMNILPLSDPLLLGNYLSDISEERQEKVRRLKTAQAKAMTTGAELLLRKALRQNYDINQPLTIVKGEHGKPRIQGCPGIHFNLSHSGDYAVCAVSSHPVGVDIQKMAEPNLKLAKRFFATKESDWLFSLPADQQRQAFYDLWVIKESFMKYTGKGFGLPMNAFAAKILGHYPDDVEIKINQDEKTESVVLKKYDYLDNYALWCCSDHNQFEENLGWVVIKEKSIE